MQESMSDSSKKHLMSYRGSLPLDGAREFVTVELQPKSPVYDNLIRLSGDQAF